MIQNHNNKIRNGWRMVLLVLLFTTSSLCNLSGQDSLILGVHPFLPHEELFSRFQPLTRFLSNELNIPIILRIGNTYDEHIRMTGNEMIDISFLGPIGYVIVTEDYGHKPLIGIFETNNRPFYKGMIIARRDAEISSISDLGRGRFAFVNPKSTMGFFVPLYQLLEAGLAETVRNQCNFLGNHKNVALGVLSGDFEAGALKEEVYEAFGPDLLKIISSTPLIPEHVFVTKSGLSPKMIDKLNMALLQLNKTEPGIEILKEIKDSATGICNTRDSDFDQLRRMYINLIRNGLIQ